MIKPVSLALLLICAVNGTGKDTSLLIRFEGEPLRACKIMQQVVLSGANQGEIERFSFDGSIGELQMRVGGKKGYDPKRFIEGLKERSVRILSTRLENKQWHINLDMREAVVDLPAIDGDSSAQMSRSIYPYWFDVSRARYITIEAPYEGFWYPELAVLDANMQVLHSSKEGSPQHQMAFELPEGSHYLKVSNSQGMHLLKEGLWVSAELNEN